MVQVRQVFRPRCGVNSPYMSGFLRGFAEGRVQFIAFPERGRPHPSPVVLSLYLGKVQVAVFVGGHDQVQSGLFRLVNGLARLVLPPGVHCFPRVVDSGISFVPELRRLPVFGEKGSHPGKEVTHLFLFVLHAGPGARLAAQRAFFPEFRGCLVASQMDDF